ncbi:hypothetical protein [Burkholderia stagnalis]|uniref:hypothetical protein n=1 Tax=Burkholderia stagnalis TaxID=1503054 RepID=UPI000F7FB0CD|nr:hypothetical protein [Burkholderia stagnalis]
MPVDLKRIGPAKQYPPKGPSLRVWAIVWVVCALLIAGTVLLLWPKNTPAQGARFWLLITGSPNVVFIALVAWNRILYENRHLHVLYYNDHRERRRSELIAEGQRALKVLGYAYRLPLESGKFARTVAEGKSLLKAQPLRDGVTIVRHLRLPEETECDPADSSLAQVLQQSSLTREGKLYAELLAPLVGTIKLLIASGPQPAIRLVATDDAAIRLSLEQIGVVANAFHLPALEVKAALDSDGLMPIDTWLDAKDPRPLLVVAGTLHELPPAESTEGGVALLLAPESIRLPQGLAPCAAIHRPVSRHAGELGEGVALGMLWGKANPSSVKHTWVTGFDDHQHTLISEACRYVGLEHLTTHESRFNPDRIVGRAGGASGWLAVAAAAEFGTECPQLILNLARTMQAAVVHAYPPQTT